MKPRNILTLLIVASLLLPAACDVKDPIFNTPHPDHGQVTLTTDWTQRDPALDIPPGYTVSASSYRATLSAATNTLDHLFAPGTHRLLAYNTPQHITVDGTTATVSAAPDAPAVTPDAAAGEYIQQMPDWLFAGLTDIPVEADTDHHFTLLMHQQVRGLTLLIEPVSGTALRIDRIEGRLSGAASMLDFSTGAHSAPRSVALAFTEVTSGPDVGKWSATVRLLGVAGPQQTLHATIFFRGNTPPPVSLTSADGTPGCDLTAALAASNADKRTPLTLGGRIVETPTEAGFGATITDWETVRGGPVVAD